MYPVYKNFCRPGHPHWYRLFIGGNIVSPYGLDRWEKIATIDCIKKFAWACGIDNIQWVGRFEDSQFIIIDANGSGIKYGRLPQI